MKRYEPGAEFPYAGYMVEHYEGKYVRYEDVPRWENAKKNKPQRGLKHIVLWNAGVLDPRISIGFMNSMNEWREVGFDDIDRPFKGEVLYFAKPLNQPDDV